MSKRFTRVLVMIGGFVGAYVGYWIDMSVVGVFLTGLALALSVGTHSQGGVAMQCRRKA